MIIIRIKKWWFFAVYAAYLLVCLFYACVGRNESLVNTMIFAITIASAALSVSDLLFLKLDIDKKERKLRFSNYDLALRLKNETEAELHREYGFEAQIVALNLADEFSDKLELLDRFLNGALSSQEKAEFENRIKQCPDNRVREFVESYSQDDIEEFQALTEPEENGVTVKELLQGAKEGEKRYSFWASLIAVFGLLCLLMIPTFQIPLLPRLNNVFTVLAFLCFMANLLVKDYYKKTSLKQLERERRELLKELKNNAAA